MKPRRIQRKRTKGWRMPPNTVYVGRPTKWGNPYRVNRIVTIDNSGVGIKVEDAETAKSLYYQYVWWKGGRMRREQIRKELKGKNLACWCPLDQPCHADVLLEIANGRGVK